MSRKVIIRSLRTRKPKVWRLVLIAMEEKNQPLFTFEAVSSDLRPCYRGIRALSSSIVEVMPQSLGTKPSHIYLGPLSIHMVSAVAGHLAVSFQRGRAFCVFDAVPVDKDLREQEQEKLNYFLRSQEDVVFSDILALRTTDSVIIALQFLTSHTPDGLVLRLLIVQRNGTFLIWCWVPQVYMWQYVSRGVLPTTPLHASHVKGVPGFVRTVTQAVCCASTSWLCWLEESVGKTGRPRLLLNACRLPGLLNATLKDYLHTDACVALPYAPPPSLALNNASLFSCSNSDPFSLLPPPSLADGNFLGDGGGRGVGVGEEKANMEPVTLVLGTAGCFVTCRLFAHICYFHFASESFTKVPVLPSPPTHNPSHHPTFTHRNGHADRADTATACGAAADTGVGVAAQGPSGLLCVHPTTRQLLGVDEFHRLIVFLEPSSSPATSAPANASAHHASTSSPRGTHCYPDPADLVTPVVQCTLRIPGLARHLSGLNAEAQRAALFNYYGDNKIYQYSHQLASPLPSLALLQPAPQSGSGSGSARGLFVHPGNRLLAFHQVRTA